METSSQDQNALLDVGLPYAGQRRGHADHRPTAVPRALWQRSDEGMDGVSEHTEMRPSFALWRM
eukprot:2820384-Amphidinium_carterae.1